MSYNVGEPRRCIASKFNAARICLWIHSILAADSLEFNNSHNFVNIDSICYTLLLIRTNLGMAHNKNWKLKRERTVNFFFVSALGSLPTINNIICRISGHDTSLRKNKKRMRSRNMKPDTQPKFLVFFLCCDNKFVVCGKERLEFQIYDRRKISLEFYDTLRLDNEEVAFYQREKMFDTFMCCVERHKAKGYPQPSVSA